MAKTNKFFKQIIKSILIKNFGNKEKIINRFFLTFFQIIFFIFITLVLFPLNIYCQDLFASKYNINIQSAASIALLIYDSPIFIIQEPIKTFIENNKTKFESLKKLYENNINEETDLNIDFSIYDSASALLKFNQINSLFNTLELKEFTLFLLDLLHLIINKDDLSLSLEKLFKENTKENINFTFIPIELSTDECLFLHIKDSKKGIDNFLFFKSNNLNNNIYQLLNYVFKERIFYTTMLPKSIELTKNEQTKFLELTGRVFLYPEVESTLESVFLIYCLNNVAENVYKYTGISIYDYIDAKSYFYKLSWYNDLLKSWDNLNNNSIFKFPKPYGQSFIEIIKDEMKILTNVSFDKLLQLNSDITCVVSIASDLLLSNRKINLIKKKLLKIGFNDVIFKIDYEKDISKYSNKKLVFIYLLAKNNENNSPFFISNNKNDFQLQNIAIKSFSEILSISYFDNIEILLIVNKPDIDSLMRAIKLIPKLKNEPIVIKRNFFQKLIDKIISIFSPLSI